MYNYFVDVIIWSFSIYGFICFMDEYLLESVCYIIMKCVYFVRKFRKYLSLKVDKKVK